MVVSAMKPPDDRAEVAEPGDTAHPAQRCRNAWLPARTSPATVDLATGRVPPFLDGSNKEHGHHIDLDKNPSLIPSSLYRTDVSGRPSGSKTPYSARL
jgi:hypothetical protein